MASRSLKDVIDRLNADPAYRNACFNDPKGFLERELPGVTIDDRLNNEMKGYFADIRERISGPNVKFGLPGEGEEGPIYVIHW